MENMDKIIERFEDVLKTTISREMDVDEEVIIYKNPNGDTRTAQKDMTFEQFQEANNMHKQDVKNVMNELAFQIMAQGRVHDFTKKTKEELFYDNFLSTINNGTDFVNDEWYQFHIKEERHHLLSNCPDDVNLLDVLEMVVDCVCEGMSRSGEVRDLKINNDMLEKAFTNTIDFIKDIVLVKSREV